MRTEPEEKYLLLEDFEIWLKTNFISKITVKGHYFEKTEDGNILIDNGEFSVEEAEALFLMLTSKNLLERINANLIIWERNGLLIKILIILSLLALIFVLIRHGIF